MTLPEALIRLRQLRSHYAADEATFTALEKVICLAEETDRRGSDMTRELCAFALTSILAEPPNRLVPRLRDAAEAMDEVLSAKARCRPLSGSET